MHDGLKLAIVGRPNTGKSSLFNALIERDRAIVTAIAGTTRDLISERVSIGGIPVELIDTAGLRETSDEAEAIGITKTREAIAEADIVLAVLDATVSMTSDSAPQPTEAESSLLQSLEDRPSIVVLNKIDLQPVHEAGIAEKMDQPGLRGTPVMLVSSLTREGIAALRKQILTTMRAGNPDEHTGLLTHGASPSRRRGHACSPGHRTPSDRGPNSARDAPAGSLRRP